MKSIALLTILSMIAMPALADTYLCVGEKTAWVSSKQGTVLQSDSGTNSDKWIVSEEGLKQFGTEFVILNDCTSDEGRPTWCERTGEGEFGSFSMNYHNLFTLFSFTINAEYTVIDFIVKGKCSKL